MNTNIDYWEKLTNDPSDAYKRLFSQEKEYLKRNVYKDDKVLDVGCGDGRNILDIIDITENIIGIDIDEVAVKDATKKLINHPSVEIILGSAFELPFDDNVFDKTILSMTLVNLDTKKEVALRELSRVTKTDGKIILSVYSEKAKNERLPMYEKIGVPIEKIEGGKFIFDKSIGAYNSEQFSIQNIEEIIKPLNLKITDVEEVENLAYILTLENK